MVCKYYSSLHLQNTRLDSTIPVNSFTIQLILKVSLKADSVQFKWLERPSPVHGCLKYSYLQRCVKNNIMWDNHITEYSVSGEDLARKCWYNSVNCVDKYIAMCKTTVLLAYIGFLQSYYNNAERLCFIPGSPRIPFLRSIRLNEKTDSDQRSSNLGWSGFKIASSLSRGG